MKFDLVLRKLWIIWLVQEIREPNHADHVIGHLETSDYDVIFDFLVGPAS